MIAFQELKKIFERTIGWEHELKDLLDVASLGVKNARSKSIIESLVERQNVILEILEGIRMEDFGPISWVRFSADVRADDLVPKKKISRNSTPEEILANVREYESKLKVFYARVGDAISSEQQRELFESLSRLKEDQMNRIDSLGR